MDSANDITVLSLCTGYGGLELGLHRALGRPLRVVAVEIEAFAEANLVAKAEEGKLAVEALYPDIKSFPAGRFSGCFDFVLAGYPCQPFSVAGKRKGEADERHLWPFIRNHIQQIRPVWCFFENVAGHLRLGFDRVVRDLDELGYTVEAGIFSAAEVGAPHRRERVFILAHAKCAEPGMRVKGIEGPEGGQRGRPANDGCRLVDSECSRQRRDARRRTKSKSTNGYEELAVRPGSGCQKQCRAQSVRPEQSAFEYGGCRWPARPREPQYEWEEPRTVEPGMGRTVDGFASRVDELRLLGNGVVPEQAELAFTVLSKKLNVRTK